MTLFGQHDAWLCAQQYPSHSWQSPGHRRAINALSLIVRPVNARTALEIGSGEPPSFTTQILKRLGIQVTTLDASAACHVLGDMHTLPFSDNSFDLAVMRHCLEHAVAPLIALREARRVASALLVVMPEFKPNWLYWGGHFSVFPRPVWEHLFRLADWEVEYYAPGSFANFTEEEAIEWRYLLKRCVPFSPKREKDGNDLCSSYALARIGWQEGVQ